MFDPFKKIGSSRTVIVANGAFPESSTALACLEGNSQLVCCDGSIMHLDAIGYSPLAIVGDLDSLLPELEMKYERSLFRDSSQESNDLTKAVRWCTDRGLDQITIIGATGLREDHTIGNISLLIDYSSVSDVIMVTDHSIIFPFSGGEIKSEKGMKVSIFSPDGSSKVTSGGLEYQLNNLSLNSWWRGTLNVCQGDSFSLEIVGGPVIVTLVL